MQKSLIVSIGILLCLCLVLAFLSRFPLRLDASSLHDTLATWGLTKGNITLLSADAVEPPSSVSKKTGAMSDIDYEEFSDVELVQESSPPNTAATSATTQQNTTNVNVTTETDNSTAIPQNDCGPDGVMLYPTSIEEYHHPFGDCSATQMNVSFKERFVDKTRVWDEIPDNRTLFATEHERCHYTMVRMLAILVAVLDKLNLHYWFISHATLLGAVRHGGMIPWDVDIDVAMPRSHLTVLRKYWRRDFPRDMFLQSEKTETAFHMWVGKERAVRIVDRYSTFAGVRFSVYKKGKRYKMKKWHLGAHIDIIPLEKKGPYMFKLLHHFFRRDRIFPSTKVCFENMVVNAPSNISYFLTELYGPDYMTPPSNVQFRGPTTLPCLATRSSRGSSWSLDWRKDHPFDPRVYGYNNILSGKYCPLTNRTKTQDPHKVHEAIVRNAKLFPRDDPGGTLEDDIRVPYFVYPNTKGYG